MDKLRHGIGGLPRSTPSEHDKAERRDPCDEYGWPREARNGRWWYDVVGGHCNGDLAEQTGPIMNVDTTYATLIKPIERRFSQKLHALANIRITYHSCGSIVPFIPHFAEIGYDAVNPVQVSAYDMEPCSLKKRYGTMISFWGGLCDTQQVLPFGTPVQVRKQVQPNMECFKPGGGYIASNIHNLTAEVPTSNITAMFDTVRRFRSYRPNRASSS